MSNALRRLRPAYHDIGAADLPIRMTLISGVGGSDLNGAFVLSRLAAYLHSVARGEKSDQQLGGRVIIAPSVSASASHSDGTPTRPGAALESSRNAYFQIDVKSPSTYLEEAPQVLLTHPNEDERSSAYLFGLPAIVERPHESGGGEETAAAYVGEHFIVHLGQSGNIQLKHCERLFRSLVSFLHRVDLLYGLDWAEDEEDVHYFNPQQVFPLVARSAGIFVSRLEVGTWIQAGELVGNLYDEFEGVIKQEVKAPVSGLVSGVRRQPLVQEDDIVAQILVRDG